MTIDSTVAGFLTPAVAPHYDAGLEDALHDIVVGITALRGDLVRPRWQPEPPQQPDFSVSWCAFGVVHSTVDVFAFEHHDHTLPANKVDRDEILFVMHSFYGPHAHAYCEMFRDGFEIGQNRDAIRAYGLALVEVGEATQLPALLKEKWVKRIDTTVQYRRRTQRVYPVATIVSANGEIKYEDLNVSFIVNN